MHQSIVLPIEVDILLLGFDEDGGYGYGLNRQALEEMLGTATGEGWVGEGRGAALKGPTALLRFCGEATP